MIQTFKPRILVCSESSKVASGFGVYNKYLIKGIYDTGLYDVAEFASYGLIGDKEQYNISWKYYPNAVNPSDPRANTYNSNSENHFGRWRFDRVVADFHPHVVIDIRDYWMSSYQKNSPFRKYFHWILMPTIDSYPQQEEWLDTFLNADAIFTYSDWGKEVLNNQTSNQIKYIDTASPSADIKDYNIVSNSEEIKNILKIDPTYTVLGTVMRNQKRKLFPELIRAFEETLDRLKEMGSEKFNKTILYLHTSFPDAGWDMHNLIKNSKYGNKIYFTYSCKHCGAIFASPLSGYIQRCYNCQNNSAVLPNVSNPISSSILGKIVGMYDVYIQYSICEGFGMPQIEAASCGVPVVTVNYSAMTDVINKINAYKVEVGSYFKELETSAIRVYPDQESLVKILIDLISQPTQIRKRKGFDIKQKCDAEYSWEKTINKWLNYLKTIDFNYYENLWAEPSQIIPEINTQLIPKTNNVYETIYFIQKNYLSRINMKMGDYWLLKQIQASQNGFYTEGAEFKKFTIDNLIDNLNTIIRNFNEAQLARKNKAILNKEDYIDYANKQ